MKTLLNYCKDDMAKYVGTVSHKNMESFINGSNGYSLGLKLMLQGVQEYCNAFHGEYQEPISTDSFLSDEIETILRSLHSLLSGHGKFDGGTLSGFICELAKENELDIE